MRKPVIILLVVLLLLLGNECNVQGGPNMRLLSPAFKDGQAIPDKFTCRGEDVNPELIIEDIPKAAKSLALIFDDPDALGGIFVHWVLYDVPVTGRIEEDSAHGKQGINTAGRVDYVSPCPPPGKIHRYTFKIYALDAMLNLKAGITKADLENAMRGHILDQAELVGLYQR